MSWEDSIKKVDEGDKYTLRAALMAESSMKHFQGLIHDLKKWITENPSHKEDIVILKVLKTYYENLGEAQDALKTFHDTIMAQWEAS
jgi:hypothetical protein